ncbi:MAG: protein kinase domain-containing protein [Gemmatimonadales bacterium]
MSDPFARLTAALGRRYTIERELGRGGMGTVYLAADLKHGRKVAIKILPPDLAAALGPARFLREIQIAARLSHPHILPLHDSGQAGGLLYYVMPYVEGESLRSRLAREKQLPVAEALEITRQVADALGSAHAAGVIHRDIKPENILLAGYPPRERDTTGGWHALLADFGVAKAFRADGADSDGKASESRTDTGLPIGTAAYASPEQAAGSRELDGRSDIYSLGCVLYEMLVGDPSNGGPTASELLEKRFAAPPPSTRRVRPEVPEWLDRAVTQALARNPAERFSSAAQFRHALAPSTVQAAAARSAAETSPAGVPKGRRLLWMAAGAAAIALIGAALAFLPRRTERLDPKRVVVAGFENRTGEASLDPVGDIATDYIARGLAVTRLLHEVYDARAAAREAGKAVRVDPAAGRDLGRKVGAGTVLWGSYYREGDSLHFEVQLLDVPSGRVILALEPALGPLSSPTKVVEVLRQRVMAAFGALFQTPGFEPWEAQSIPPTYEAYREFLAGYEAGWEFDSDRAVRHFRRAAALDSTYVGAKTALALELEENHDCAAADSIATLLGPIRDRLPPVDRGNLDWATAQCRGDVAGALEAGRSVIEAAPGSVGFVVLASVMALELFRPREALAILHRLDSRRRSLTGIPRGMYWGFQAGAYHQLGDYRRELEVLQEGGENPGTALAALGRVIEARQLGDTMLSSDDADGAQCLALELRAHGHLQDAQEMLDKVVTWYRAHPDADPGTSDHSPCLWLQLSALYHAGRYDEARADYERLAAADSSSVKARAGLGALAARRGNRPEVARIDQWLIHQTGSRGQAAYARARMAALLGNPEQAVALLRKAFDGGLLSRSSIHTDPDFESLRVYPPYRELMRSKG